MSELKQLNFVDNTARSVMELAENTYSRVRGLVPGFLLSPVSYTENVVAPYYGKAQTLAHNVLVNIDGKVDYGVVKSQDILKTGVDKTRSVVGDDAAEQFQEAKSKYVTVVSESCRFVYKNGVAGTASAIIHKRGEAFEHIKTALVSAIGATVSGAQATIDNLARQPAVQAAVDTAKPYADFAQAKYAYLHDRLVHMPQYATLYKLCENAYCTLSGNVYVKGAYDKSTSVVYPYVKSVADPTVEKVTPYVEALKEHLQPATDKTADIPMPTSTSKPVGENSTTGHSQPLT